MPPASNVLLRVEWTSFVALARENQAVPFLVGDYSRIEPLDFHLKVSDFQTEDTLNGTIDSQP